MCLYICLYVYGQYCKKWPNFIMLRSPQLFWDMVIDGIEVLNGDFETLILNIKDVMDTKTN